MVARTAVTGTTDPGDVWTSANVDSLPGGWLGYVEVTADQGSITTIVDLTGLSVAVTVNDDRRLSIRTHGGFTLDTAARVINSIRESSTTLRSGSQVFATTGAGGETDVANEVVITPSGGAHTYKWSAQATSGTATLKASSTAPAFLLVTDIGPAT